MTASVRRMLSVFGTLLVLMLVGLTPLLAVQEVSENDLIQQLHSANPEKVLSALSQIATEYPRSTNAVSHIRELLANPRYEKRARQVLNVLPIVYKEQLIEALQAPEPEVCIRGLEAAESHFMAETDIVPYIEKLVRSSDVHVRRKAARILGLMHAQITSATVHEITSWLKLSDYREIIDALKSLRDLQTPGVVPEILPLLKHRNANVVRDACRTLAVVGDKDVIPQIEPLLRSNQKPIKLDAEKAIAALRAKS